MLIYVDIQDGRLQAAIALRLDPTHLSVSEVLFNRQIKLFLLNILMVVERFYGRSCKVISLEMFS